MLWLELNNGLQARKENPLPEILLGCKILQVLPIQFETFKTSWMLLRKNEGRKFEEMSAQLTMYYQLSEHPTTSPNAKKDDTWNYCGEKGHWLRDCKKWISPRSVSVREIRLRKMLSISFVRKLI